MPPLHNRNDPFWIFHVEPQSQTTSVKKSVSFASHAQQFPVLGRANYSQLEMQNSWYAKPDFVHFAIDIRRTVQIIENEEFSRLLDDVNYTKRGSICRKECTARRRKQVRDGAKVCVLKAQDESRRNADYISSVYIRYSQPSVREALMQANQDHYDAKLVHAQPAAAAPQPVENLLGLDNFFSDAWITNSANGSPAATAKYQQPPDLLTDGCFVKTEPGGFDDAWLLGPGVM